MKNIESILNEVLDSGRLIDYYLIKNLNENFEEKLLNELIKYQNSDGGFGNCLEPDIRMPESSVAASNVGISILDEIKSETLKEEVVRKLIKYYESVFNYEIYAFDIVPKEVDNYPRALWWNYDSKDNFTFGNPNPEVCGFLFKYKAFLEVIDINKYLNKVLNYVRHDLIDGSMHCVLSVLTFYNKVSREYQSSLKPIIQRKIDKEMKLYIDDSNGYILEPYKVELASTGFLDEYKNLLQENISKYIKIINDNKLIMPNWEWYQYNDVFNNEAKNEWASYITFMILKSINKIEKEN